MFKINNFREMRAQRGCNRDFKSIKLAPNFFPKNKYIVHLRNLQMYLSEGVVLKKIHRAISFRQEAWIAPYIAENTRLRQQAVDDFEKDFFKLLNNAFFGKQFKSFYFIFKIQKHSIFKIVVCSLINL